MLGCSENIKLGSSDGEVDRINIGGDEGPELGSSNGVFGYSNDVNLKYLLLGDSLELVYGTQICLFGGTLDLNEDSNQEGPSLQDSLVCTYFFVFG